MMTRRSVFRAVLAVIAAPFSLWGMWRPQDPASFLMLPTKPKGQRFEVVTYDDREPIQADVYTHWRSSFADIHKSMVTASWHCATCGPGSRYGEAPFGDTIRCICGKLIIWMQPIRYLTPEDMLKMDCPFPPEPDWS